MRDYSAQIDQLKQAGADPAGVTDMRAADLDDFTRGYALAIMRYDDLARYPHLTDYPTLGDAIRAYQAERRSGVERACAIIMPDGRPCEVYAYKDGKPLLPLSTHRQADMFSRHPRIRGWLENKRDDGHD